MLYVYQIPKERSHGYCFGGGVPITFMNVDWFGTPHDEVSQDKIQEFIAGKRYFEKAPPGSRFLVLCDDRPDMTFQMVRP